MHLNDLFCNYLIYYVIKKLLCNYLIYYVFK